MYVYFYNLIQVYTNSKHGKRQCDAKTIYDTRGEHAIYGLSSCAIRLDQSVTLTRYVEEVYPAGITTTQVRIGGWMGLLSYR